MPTNQTAAVVNDIHDIKPPMEIPEGLAWLWWTLGALLVLFLLWLVWRHFQQHANRSICRRPFPHMSAPNRNWPKPSRCCRNPSRFACWFRIPCDFIWRNASTFDAPERTTEEFLRELQNTNLLAGEQKESLGRFLESCDLVKFAKYEPGESELQELHHSAVKLVEETEPESAD
jgi:hypothetical protein